MKQAHLYVRCQVRGDDTQIATIESLFETLRASLLGLGAEPASVALTVEDDAVDAASSTPPDAGTAPQPGRPRPLAIRP